VVPHDAAIATALALAIALSSFLTSLVVAGRDRAKLAIQVRRGFTTPALAEALVVQVTNAGRRPVGLNPLVHLLLADGSELVAADPRWYHDAPATHLLAEAQCYLVVIPLAVWQEQRQGLRDAKRRDPCDDARKFLPRCVAVGVVDNLGRRHRAGLPRGLAAWFNT
jgi:hypothetical protein